jgi:hypothetical protein
MNPIHLFPLGRGDGNSPRMRCSTRYQRLEEILAAKQKRCKEISGGTEGVQRSRQSRRGTGSWDEDEGVVLISAAGRRRKPSGRVFA